MSRRKGSKKRVPLSCLGPDALRQLREAGVDVDGMLSKEKGNSRGKIRSFDLPFHKFNVAPGEERTVDNHKFDSKLEASAYRFLKERGISFDCQVSFILEEGFEFNGKKYRPLKYVSDFVIDPSGRHLVIDMKGMVTPIYALKQKLMLKKHGIQIICLKNLPALAGLLHDNGLM